VGDGRVEPSVGESPQVAHALLVEEELIVDVLHCLELINKAQLLFDYQFETFAVVPRFICELGKHFPRLLSSFDLGFKGLQNEHVRVCANSRLNSVYSKLKRVLTLNSIEEVHAEVRGQAAKHR
jgi:hypothetical protein